jgi:integrase/recombinase XerD
VLGTPGPAAAGALFCVIDGATRGRRWSATAARAELRHLALEAGVRHRFAPTSSGQHANLGITSIYLQGIDPSEIIDAVRSRRQPTIPATAGLTL